MNGILHRLLYQSQNGIIVHAVITEFEVNELPKGTDCEESKCIVCVCVWVGWGVNYWVFGAG